MKIGRSRLSRVGATSAFALVTIFAAHIVEAAPSGKVVITDGWFRVLPASLPSGGYFTLSNKSDKKITINSVESAACGMLMLHKSSGGSMEHVMSLDVAAGETIQFTPGSYHLMCTDTKPVLKPGALVPVTFHFADGQTIVTNFKARDAKGK